MPQGGLGEIQAWSIVSAAVALAVAIIVTVVVAYRMRGATEKRIRADLDGMRDTLQQRLAGMGERNNNLEAQFKQTADALGRQSSELQVRVEETAQRVGRLEGEVRLARTQTSLQQAVVRGTRARTHLAEQNSGLAERDLTETDAALQRALALAPQALKPRIEEVRRSLNELKGGVEARTFPVASVEILTDHIDSLVEGTGEPRA